MSEKVQNNTSLVQQQKPKIGGQKFGLAKKIAEKQTLDFVFNANTYPNRLGIIADDSGSMNGSMDKVHLAIDTFLKNCNSGDTCVALYPLNTMVMKLTNNFASIGLMAHTLRATGGTPLYTKLQLLLQEENITRAIAFSDGEPTDNTSYHSDEAFDLDEHYKPTNKHTETIRRYVEKKVPIDTIYIGYAGSTGYKTMLRIAEETNGIFLHFTDASVLAKSLKYLTPHYRAMLCGNTELKAQVEKGTAICL